MPAAIKPEWLARLRAIDSQAELQFFGPPVNRWAVRLVCGDGALRWQFYGWYRNPLTGQPIPPDPVSGLQPYRDLDDAAIDEMCHNLQATFVGNRWDGAGSPRKEILRRMAANRAAGQAHYRKLGEEWADRFLDRTRRMRGEPLIPVGVDLKRSA